MCCVRSHDASCSNEINLNYTHARTRRRQYARLPVPYTTCSEYWSGPGDWLDGGFHASGTGFLASKALARAASIGSQPPLCMPQSDDPPVSKPRQRITKPPHRKCRMQSITMPLLPGMRRCACFMHHCAFTIRPIRPFPMKQPVSG